MDRRSRANDILMTAAFFVAIGVVTWPGCATDQSTSSSPPHQEIRRDSDQFFEKLKQEERERGRDSGMPVR